ncbi:hypothetical protein [Nocardia salmonicida]|uniref:hypothetical protein n=1 Tax=Nocardia salmonicida TaxID=53431 RepID=UPI0007A3A5FD|nr:hypothetical protein [Nocardia salmonicida]
MCRSSGPRTDAELRRQLEWALGEAQQGRGRTHLSLNSDVQDGLLEIMDATPDVSADLIAAAQSAFADQLAGVGRDTRDTELNSRSCSSSHADRGDPQVRGGTTLAMTQRVGFES